MAESGQPIRVLLVDDTADIRELLRLSLERDGRFVVAGEAENGLEAVRLAARLKPDAIVLDLAMPLMDGLEALPKIGRVSPSTSVVVLSGFSAADLAEEALARGARAYVEKGGVFETIAETIAELVRVTAAPAEPSAVAPVPAEANELDELFSFVTHELLTPVAIVQGFAKTLRKRLDLLDRNQIAELAHLIERNARNLSELVGSFADAHAVEAGELALRRAPTDVAGLVREATADLEPLTGTRPVSLELEDVVLDVDPVRVRQVLTNVVSNAVKFSPEGSPIEIGVRSGEGAVELWVRDHGVGIPRDRREDVFGKFVRLGDSGRGMGIGLYLARGIARAHGGDLTVEEARGGGARFVLSLPLPARAAPPAHAAPTHA